MTSGEVVLAGGDDGTVDLITIERDGQVKVKVDLRKLATVEARIPEVRNVTSQKAPELLALFNVAYNDANTLLARATYELAKARNLQNEEMSRLKLDEVPGKLKALGVKDTQDHRDCVLNTFPSYRDLCERESQLEAVVAFLKGKMKGFEMAFSAVKTLVRDARPSPWIGVNGNTNPSISDGETSDGWSEFGQARY